VLFDGKNLDEWMSASEKERGKTPAQWIVSNDELTVNKSAAVLKLKGPSGTTNFTSNGKFRRTSLDRSGAWQQRRVSRTRRVPATPDMNCRYSIPTTTNLRQWPGRQHLQAGYSLANPTRKPGEWQTYDVVGPLHLNTDGSLKTPAYVTVFFNGVLVQNHFELKGETRYAGQPFYKKCDAAPIKLQAHGDKSEPISFRNIWVGN